MICFPSADSILCCLLLPSQRTAPSVWWMKLGAHRGGLCFSLISGSESQPRSGTSPRYGKEGPGCWPTRRARKCEDEELGQLLFFLFFLSLAGDYVLRPRRRSGLSCRQAHSVFMMTKDYPKQRYGKKIGFELGHALLFHSPFWPTYFIRDSSWIGEFWLSLGLVGRMNLFLDGSGKLFYAIDSFKCSISHGVRWHSWNPRFGACAKIILLEAASSKPTKPIKGRKPIIKRKPSEAKRPLEERHWRHYISYYA